MMMNLVSRWPSLVAGVGAMLCITILASLEQLNGATLWLMAPFGATMVILFGLPDSPLAQPKNIILGHILTTLVGLIILYFLGVSAGSLGLAVGLAVALMLATKTTHPPAGANPLVVMLSGQTWGFVVTPVAIGAIIIVLFGLVYHRWVCRRGYPKTWF